MTETQHKREIQMNTLKTIAAYLCYGFAFSRIGILAEMMEELGDQLMESREK